MHDSAEITRAFYVKLGADGLAAQTDPEWEATLLEQLATMLRPGDCIADIGCGYGRIAIPLARRGYRVTGLDLSPVMLSAARKSARDVAADVAWREGSMCRMPLATDSFDAVVCLWSGFYELLNPDEQLDALCEMYRILRPGGWGLIDGPVYMPATDDELASGTRSGPDGRLVNLIIQGHLNMHYAHDDASLTLLSQEAKLDRYQVEVTVRGGYFRQNLRFEKRG